MPGARCCCAPPVARRGGFFGNPLRSSSRFGHQDASTPPFPTPCESRGRGDAHRGRFFGKPLRAISRFSHQNAQTPPSPRVGEGGRGMRGNGARECRTSRISPKNSTLERRGDEGRTHTGTSHCRFVFALRRLRISSAEGGCPGWHCFDGCDAVYYFLRIFHEQRYICDEGQE